MACDDESYRIFELDCLGTKGRLNLTHAGFEVEYYSVAPSHLFPDYRALYPAPPPVNKDVPHEFMVEGVRHLVRCLHEGVSSISSGEDGRAALELICAFHQSAREEGHRVELPLQDSPVVISSR
jgi:predicted dehydrogenase